MDFSVVQADRLDFFRSLPAASVDLVFGSPPYEAARTYGIDFKLSGQAWVDWMVETYVAAQAACRGLVAFVLEGQTRDYRWSAVPALLMADLHRRGLHLRKPPIFHRVGIPGSGGPDWLRNDWEWIVCTGPGGKLPWSDNTAMGHPPKWAPGGEMSNRQTDGSRVNEHGCTGAVTTHGRHKATKDAYGFSPHDGEPSQTQRANGKRRLVGPDGRTCAASKGNRIDKRIADGAKSGGDELQSYDPPVLANPGNTIQQLYAADEVAALLADAGNVTHHLVGGGVMGSDLAHLNEAPYPESLCEFFILSFCPPGGTVVDCFSGSGTTAAVAVRHGRKFTGCDVRESQVELTKQRVANETPLGLFS